MKLTTIIILLFLAFDTVQAETLAVASDRDYNLAPYIEILETPDELTLEEAKSKDGWVKNSGFNVQRGLSSKHFWFRVTLKNDSNPETMFLNLNANQLDIVDFYVMEKNQFQVFHAGDHRPFHEWGYSYSSPTLKLFLDKGKIQTVYVHVKSTSFISFMVNLHSEESFSELRLHNKLLHRFYGLIEIIYILLLFIISKRTGNRHYLYLIPVSLSYTLYILMISGNSYPLWPGLAWLQDRLLVLAASLLVVIVPVFIDGFLNLKKHFPLLHYVFIASVILTLFNFSAIWKITIFSQYWLLGSVYFNYFLILGSIIMSYRSGKKYVIYILILWLVVIGGIIIRVLALNAMLPYNTLTYNSAAYQFPLALVLILKAIYDKYNLLERENKELGSKYNELMNRLEMQKPVKRISGLDIKKIIHQIQEMIKKDKSIYDVEFNLQQMSNTLGIRPDQLSQILNQELNTSFSRFLNTIRIHKSCELMKLYPDKTITGIFLDCGFSSKNPFNNAFREIMNSSPSEYRAQNMEPHGLP